MRIPRKLLSFFFFCCSAIRQTDHRVSQRRPVRRMDLSTASGSLCSTVSEVVWPRRADRAAWHCGQSQMTRCSVSSATPHSGHRPSVSGLFYLNRVAWSSGQRFTRSLWSSTSSRFDDSLWNFGGGGGGAHVIHLNVLSHLL